jgi:hypothetical protein
VDLRRPGIIVRRGWLSRADGLSQANGTTNWTRNANTLDHRLPRHVAGSPAAAVEFNLRTDQVSTVLKVRSRGRSASP